MIFIWHQYVFMICDDGSIFRAEFLSMISPSELVWHYMFNVERGK